MDGRISVAYLQSYIKSKDYKPELVKDYFLRMTEEAGELATAMRKGLRPGPDGDIINTIDEELWDVMYYALAIANCYGIDMESVIEKKAVYNYARYPSPQPFQLGR